MKFTKSLPAKAIAKAKVPTSTITFRMLTLQMETRNCESNVKKRKHIPISNIEFWSIQTFASGPINVVPLAPLSNI